MASRFLPLLVFLLAAATVSARPCKTIFSFSATTTYYPFNPHHRNPNSDSHSLIQAQNPRYLTLIFTATSRFPIRRIRPDFGSAEPFSGDARSSPSIKMASDLPPRIYSAVTGSIRNRSGDFLIVIEALAALLLGAGCGALTATAIYSVYILFSVVRSRRVDPGEVDPISSVDDASDDFSFIKQFGYVAVPDAPKLADDDLKKPTKEVV